MAALGTAFWQIALKFAYDELKLRRDLCFEDTHHFFDLTGFEKVAAAVSASAQMIDEEIDRYQEMESGEFPLVVDVYYTQEEPEPYEPRVQKRQLPQCRKSAADLEDCRLEREVDHLGEVCPLRLRRMLWMTKLRRRGEVAVEEV
ncbi:hypothetical protein BGZ90_010933 [Linnemannia elongata]|nr:hypothetical protein BGZ90_010933 [Linnemannia elongata]